MSYYTRIFCTSDETPTIQEILDNVKMAGFNLILHEKYENIHLNSNYWKNFAFYYKKNKKPIIVEITKEDDELFKKEINEFLKEIGSAVFSSSKRKVINHLKKTKFIIANELRTEDIDDDGYNANGELLEYISDVYDGIIQADGEGFYQGSKIIIPLK
jgi:hypothetical protein